jgi:hypothetical protein
MSSSLPNRILIFTGALLALTLQPAFAAATEGSCQGAGPQAPRDVHSAAGTNPVDFAVASSLEGMNLCDIHFHKFAEHKASGYPTLAGSGDHRGYICEGSDPSPIQDEHGADHGEGCTNVAAGDTIEVHWVFSSCDVEPGPTLGSCASALCVNPQLRVEARVFLLTEGEDGALDFAEISDPNQLDLPAAEDAVLYLGSTTGPSFDNDTCSPYQVTWNVSPHCQSLDLASLHDWCADNVFEEDHGHGVRTLVTPLELLSAIE